MFNEEWLDTVEKHNKSNIKHFFNILSICLRWKYLIVGIFAFNLVCTVTLIIAPNFLGGAIDQLIIFAQDTANQESFELIDKYLLIALLLSVLSNLFLCCQNQASILLSQKICYYIRDKLVTKISKLPYAYFENHITGDVISRFTNDVDLIGENLSTVLISIISTVISIIGIFIAMTILNPYIAFLLIMFSLINFLVLILIVKFSQKYYISQQENLGEINGFINESYSAQEIIISYRSEKTFYNKFDLINEKLFKDGLCSSFLSRLVMTINNLFYLCSFSIVILFGSKLISENLLTIGDLQTFLMYSFLISLPLSEVSTVVNLGQQIVAAGKRIFDFLEEKEIDTTNLCIDSNKINSFDIVIKNLSFQYNEDSVALKDVSLNIPEFSKVAIVGQTGSGKSTISKLLLGFYDGYTGSIKIGGSELNKIKKKDLRDIVGIIPQDVWLHSGTIAQNISFENENIDYEKVKLATKMACIDTLIEDLPDSYNYTINDTLDNLSLGQRQMINIARAFYTDKNIIIFDEATSYIDTYSEALVQDAINNLSKHKTVIIIAHRLVTVKDCDNIFVFQNGSMVEQGNHNSLLTKKGVYYNLYQSK